MAHDERNAGPKKGVGRPGLSRTERVGVVARLMSARSVSVTRKVQQQILDYIVEAGLQVGDRLPTEPELCAKFGVSRTAAREAMKYLEALGVVSIERGRGTFLRAFDVGQLVGNIPTQLVFQKGDILEVVRVRQTLEEYCLEQAIVHGEEEDVKRLGAIVKAMERRAAHGASMEAEDREFHRHLANMANARLALMILEIFWDLRGKLPVDNSPEALKRRYLCHYRIYQAVRMRDLQLGRVYLGEHFSGSYEELLPSLDPARGAAIGAEQAATNDDDSTSTCKR